jgi:hypothetical protein
MPGNARSAAEVDPPVQISWSVGLGVALVLALLAACAAPAALKGGSSCGDQCSTLSCPPGTHCMLTGNCTPYCQQDTLAPR